MRTSGPRTTVDLVKIIECTVVDGDTLGCLLLGPLQMTTRHRVRLKDWYADERRGPRKVYGDQAAQRLEAWVKDKDLWLFCPEERFDRYGRLVARLWWHGRAITAPEVLGDLALTKAAHNAFSAQCGSSSMIEYTRKAAGS